MARRVEGRVDASPLGVDRKVVFLADFDRCGLVDVVVDVAGVVRDVQDVAVPDRSPVGLLAATLRVEPGLSRANYWLFLIEKNLGDGDATREAFVVRQVLLDGHSLS